MHTHRDIKPALAGLIPAALLCGPIGPGPGRGLFRSLVCDVASFPQSHYPKREVVRAGEALRGVILWDGDDEGRREEAYKVFKIAWDWRDSHAYPMRMLRHELAGKVKRAKVKGGITAARMKRMESIRKKLRRLTTTLPQIDDLGGCRAIVGSVSELNTILDIYRDGGSLHKLRRDRSYIEKPKLGGYRSHHLVYQFEASESDEEIYNGRRIELQLRTRLQHAWATAVEAVGLALNQDLKAGEGDADWLRLFDLISSEFAESEGCPAIPGAPEGPDRVAELGELTRRLKAIVTLDNWNRAISKTESLSTGAKYFRIQYDNNKKTVDVRGYWGPEWADTHSISEEESSLTTVFVEVDKIENLRDAFPNYFLDVSLFTENLERILQGRELLPKAGPESALTRIGMTSTADYSWLRNWRSKRRRHV